MTTDGQQGMATDGQTPPVSSTPDTSAPAQGNPDSGTTTNQPTGQPATQQPSDGRFVSNEELGKYERYRQQADGARKTYDQVREYGYESFDQAFEDLATYRDIKNDPHTSRVLEALRTADQTGSDGDPQGQPEAQKSVEEIVNDILASRDQQEAQRRYQSDLQREEQLIQQTISNGPMKDTFGEHSFADALSGKAGDAALGVASLLDSAMYSLAPKDQNGRSLPITDPAVFNQVQERAASILNALKAKSIMDASTSLTEPSDKHHHSEDAPFDPNADAAERKRRADEQFQRIMREQMGEGLPASQLG